MAVSLDLTKTPKAAFYDLLTKSTTALPEGEAFTDADLTASNITAVSGREDGANTSVLLTPVASSTLVYGEAKTVYYLRKDIAGYAIEKAITDDLANWDEADAAASALAYLVDKFSSSMVASDIVVAAPVTNEDSTVSVKVTMAENHLTLFGTITLTITAAETRMNTTNIPDTQDGFGS